VPSGLKLAAWFKASEAAALGTMDLPSCSGEALVTVFVGDAYQGTLSQDGDSFQETLVFDQRAPGKFDLLSRLSSTDKDATLEYVVEKR